MCLSLLDLARAFAMGFFHLFLIMKRVRIGEAFSTNKSSGDLECRKNDLQIFPD